VKIQIQIYNIYSRRSVNSSATSHTICCDTLISVHSMLIYVNLSRNRLPAICTFARVWFCELRMRAYTHVFLLALRNVTKRQEELRYSNVFYSPRYFHKSHGCVIWMELPRSIYYILRTVIANVRHQTMHFLSPYPNILSDKIRRSEIITYTKSIPTSRVVSFQFSEKRFL